MSRVIITRSIKTRGGHVLLRIPMHWCDTFMYLSQNALLAVHNFKDARGALIHSWFDKIFGF